MDSFPNLCRFCLSPNQAELPIFEPTETEHGTVYEKINQCFRLEIGENDDLPQKICCECFRSIDFIFSFWQLSSDSERQLRAMLDNNKDGDEIEFSEGSETVYETIMLKDVDVVIDDKQLDIIIASAGNYKDTDIQDIKIDDCNTDKRKRPRNPEGWARNVRKYLRNSGQPYIDSKNRQVSGKVFQNKSCQCRRKCSMPADEREQLFQSFWQLQDYSKQNLYLCDLLRTTATARGRPKDHSRKPKSKSVQYFLQPENKPAVQVCKTFFLDTFVITQKRIYKCLNKKDVTEVMDLRGKRRPANKIDASCVQSVKEHIRSVLNDNRSCEEKKNQDLTVVAMYKLYEAWCAENATRPVKMHYYYKVFNENFKSHPTE